MADWWEGKCWRFIQTNLREIDMADISAEQVVADMQAFRANVLMINAVGIIASYPTKLPYHFWSPFLTGHSLQEIIAACHEADVRVMARTDFSKIRRTIYEDHPDWASVTSGGQVIDYNGDIQACVNGPYQQTYTLKIIEELLTTHAFDGIFFNMGGYKTSDYSGRYYGICHCGNCARLFREMFALALPEKEDRADPVFRKYRVFQQRTLAAHHRKVYRFISDLRPDICIANHREFGRGFNRMESNTGLDRPLPHWQYSGSDNTKRAVSSYPDMVCSNTTVDFIDFPYRHVAVSPHQQALRLAQGMANGGALDTYVIGRLDNHEDRSGFEEIRKIYHYHAENEEAYRDKRSKARVALLNGDQEEFRGWFRFLTENHHVFDSLTSEAAEELPWDRYQAVVSPDLRAMSDGLADKIDRFVEGGGTLIAVGQTGFGDADDEVRNEPGLRCLGISEVLRVRRDTRSSYFKLDDKTGMDRSEATDLLFLDGSYVYADYEGDVIRRLKLIPPHLFGSPERCYYTQVTDHPRFTVRAFGKGKAVYVPWNPGRLFHRHGYLNTFNFAADLLEGIAELRPVGGNLPPTVEVTWFEKTDGGAQFLHLVNGSGHFGVSFFEPVRMTDLEVVLPFGEAPKQVSSLPQGRDYGFDWAEGSLTIRVPELGLFDAIKLM